MTTAGISRTWRTILSLTTAVALCFVLVGKAAHAAEQIDQNNLPEWAGGWTHVSPTGEGHAAMWQTFMPACPNLIAVEIDILTVNPGRGDDVLTVEIAKDGDILASADCSVADGFDGLLRFEFPDAVPVVPEQVYELTVRDTGTTRFGWKYGSNTYERGSRYVFAQERPGTDWFFQTYSNVEPAESKYSGGTGESDDPYQIATAADLIALGETPDDYDKHFIMTADIDLDPNLPGRKVFDKAIIAPYTTEDTINWFYGSPFTGVFDGNGHIISHLTIEGEYYLGLFGKLGTGEVTNLGLIDVNITGSDDYVGGLVGQNEKAIINECYVIGSIVGASAVGGLVGVNSYCWEPNYYFGSGKISNCYAACSVTGSQSVGGLSGENEKGGTVRNCYSTSQVAGDINVGGLVGTNIGVVSASFWDVQTSGQIFSDGGEGKTTVEMQAVATFDKIEVGWGCDGFWTINDGKDYPRLCWENKPGEPIDTLLSDFLGGEGTEDNPYVIYTLEDIDLIVKSPCEQNKYFRLGFLSGEGTQENPYLIYTAEELDLLSMCPYELNKCFWLMSDIDLSGATYSHPVIQSFKGTFNGKGHVISNLTMNGSGFFGRLNPKSEVQNLGIINVDVNGVSDVGGLAGWNDGTISNCYSTGMVNGKNRVGGLIGYNGGSITTSYSIASASGTSDIGGLVGSNAVSIATSYSNGSASGSYNVGGLVGLNLLGASIDTSYSGGLVSGDSSVGGLVGYDRRGWITMSYSSAQVGGNMDVGGLVGSSYHTGGYIPLGSASRSCFWDTQTSGQPMSAFGTGRTTDEMQTADTFLLARTDMVGNVFPGWDFVDETDNGTDDIWWILEGQDYPRLWWESTEQ